MKLVMVFAVSCAALLAPHAHATSPSSAASQVSASQRCAGWMWGSRSTPALKLQQARSASTARAPPPVNKRSSNADIKACFVRASGIGIIAVLVAGITGSGLLPVGQSGFSMSYALSAVPACDEMNVGQSVLSLYVIMANILSVYMGPRAGQLG